METAELIRDAALFGGTIPNNRILEVEDYLKKAEILINEYKLSKKVGTTRPPLGLKPKTIYWEEKTEQRFYEVITAINSYKNSERLIPREWLEELESLSVEITEK